MKTTWLKYLVSLVLVMSALTVSGALLAQDDTATQPGFLGIGYAEAEDGVLITEVMPESSAAEAGLQPDDVITAVNDEAVTHETIAEVISAYQAGDSLTLTVLRDGESEDITLTLGERPAEVEAVEAPGRRGHGRDGGRGRGMVPMGALNFAERPYLGITLQDGDNGPVIAAVEEDSPAAEAGLQVDDVILSINDEAVETSQDAVQLVRALNPGDEVTLTVDRDGETLEINAVLGQISAGNIPFNLDGIGNIFAYDGSTEQWSVIGIQTDSTLAEAGLQRHDIITAFNGEALDQDGLSALLETLEADDTVALTVERDGETVELEVSAEALSTISNVFSSTITPGHLRNILPFGNKGRLGVTFVSLDEATAAEHDVTVTEGALITEVQADSPAAEAGLEVGDIIVSVEGDIVDLRRDLADRIYAFEAGDVITLEVLRGEETLTIEVTLGENNAVPFRQGEFFQGSNLFGPDLVKRLLPFGFDESRLPNFPRIPRGPRYHQEAPNL